MNLFFLFPLTIGLATSYISKYCVDEMAYLTAVVKVISLILTLALAPWQIQILVLIIVLISTRLLLLQNEYSLIPEANKQSTFPWREPPGATLNTSSKLNSQLVSYEPTPSTAKVTKDETIEKYRGISYMPMPSTAKITEGEMAGKYRGTPWKTQNCKKSFVLQPASNLKYRGVKVSSQKSDKPSQ